VVGEGCERARTTLTFAVAARHDPPGFAWLETPVFNSVSAAFNPTRSSMFTLPDLVAMLAFLKSSKAMFASYDPAGRGVISLSLNQFCYAASNTM
jgi:hypothetical protein